MSVPGRKAADHRASDFHGSADDTYHDCDPCLTDGQHIEAYGYCVDCREYLCRICYRFHKKMSALKGHQLLDKGNIEKGSTTVSKAYIQTCDVHKGEVINFFCHKHEVLACFECVIMNHKSCDPDFIPEKCSNIRYSDEYRDVLGELEEKINAFEKVIDLATERDIEIDAIYDEVVKELVKYRKEINTRLDKLQKKIQTEAEMKKATDKLTVRKVLGNCTAISLEFRTLQSTLHDCESSRYDETLYIIIKQVQSKLKIYEVEKALKELETTTRQHVFQRDAHLDKLLAEINAFGALTIVSVLEDKKAFTVLNETDEINVKTKSDNALSPCCITGCTILASNKLALADNSEKKIKLVDTQSKSVIIEQPLDSYPYDIVVLPTDQVAVTISEKKEVLIMSCVGRSMWNYLTLKQAYTMSVVRRIPVKGNCKGIAYCQNNIYVVRTGDAQSVIMFDVEGAHGNVIPIHKDIEDPCYIAVNEDSELIYISDFANSQVVCITLQGDITARYQHENLSGPRGLVMIDNDTLLVCCFNNGTIHRISGDLIHGQIMKDKLGNPRSICYNPRLKEISLGSDNLKVFKVS